MEKQKKWKFFLILSVILVTLYHILPTLFYYMKPLHDPIQASQAKEISAAVQQRVEDIQGESKEWIESFCDSLGTKPQEIKKQGPNWLVRFIKTEDLAKFKTFFPRAGSLIPFAPAQLRLAPQEDSSKEALVQRQIPISLHESYFLFAPQGSAEYQEIVLNRAAQIAYALTNRSFSEIKTGLAKESFLDLTKESKAFSEMRIDWAHHQIALKPRGSHQILIEEAAKVARSTNETLQFEGDQYIIHLGTLPHFSGFLALDLETVGKAQAEEILHALRTLWNPKDPDLQSLNLVDTSSYETLSSEQKALSLVVHAPSEVNPHLRLTAKGIDRLQKTAQDFPDSDSAQLFQSDLRSLAQILSQHGFYPYRSAEQELFFEKPDFFPSLLAATRERFEVKGSGKYALLELSNLEERLITLNRIETEIHEDLIKWRDEYNAGQVNIRPDARFEVPKPTKSVGFSNFMLSWRKFFRGDEKKVIHWGLDLSGGKTVQIELRDVNNRVVKEESQLKQGMNELYKRVNKMGVSEVAIRQLGHQIVLDFPGSQSLSASELIKASSMYFHVVNEKFSSLTSPLANATQRFLQEVWNEALVTNHKDAESINAIAWNHLHQEPLSESARTLLNNGLVFSSPENPSMNSSFDDAISKIALIRDGQWFGQAHPLLIVFQNYALEGSQLESIQPGYDPQKGNYLSFNVVSSSSDREGQKIYPRETLQAWTARFSKEKILGTNLEDFTKGRGWRMAVILNETVISAPSLDAVIRDSASISGSFSQREVNQLAADLKAGSLSFTPHILSEKNVSPELGQKDRLQGMIATVVALGLVILSMVVYYRFAGLIASIAVLFNLLILWGALQNIGATLSLAGIAGIILTVGMAVDANVLVFERVKEEFAQTGRIGYAISEGYKKAYTAIIDSNVTTIIAALILLNFDAGPIKGFAITLIIGIVSSMFTALFMTRFYFNHWLQNPKHQTLKMANWIQAKSIDFLKQTKLSFIIATAIILIGGCLVYTQRATLFGMDFTGGHSIYLEVEPKENISCLHSVEEALLSHGASNRDFQIRELTPSNHLRILFSTTMEQAGKPFFNMPLETDKQTNPRIDWILSALLAKDIHLTSNSLGHLDANWTAMSGQMSESMRNHALLGLLISFICIFVYITIRFEYKFAAASILCLLHDVLITVGIMGILHAIGVPVQIDLNTVAAIMTIVGYSLNDTIIVFDRIREEMAQSRKPLAVLVNQALNATLSRTTITSGTTLLVLIALVALGGSSIFSFALVMAIGVFFGTLSSWYIASPLMLFFHNREEKLWVEKA